MALLGAVAVRMQVPGAVKVITAVAAVTEQPVAPAESTEYAGVPPPAEIVASAEAGWPEFVSSSVVDGDQVMDRVAATTVMVSDTGADALCVEVAPATTCTVHVP